MKRVMATGLAIWLGVSIAAIGIRAQSSPASSADAPTFHRDVLPILQKNCQSCHRSGQIGPMPLLSYEGVRPWARAIKNKVVAREMPPWFADPHYSQFSNDRRLSDRDIDTIARWADAGAPAGDPNDAPAPVTWPKDGWEIQPEVVVDAVQIKVPAAGIVEWINVTVPSGFTKDTWITSMEVRPGDRSVVHHVCVTWQPHVDGVKYYTPQWQDKPRDDEGRELPRSVAVVQRGALSIPGHRLHCYVPGVAAYDYGALGAATLIPAGADLTFSLHYNASGKDTVDLTRVGFTIARQPPQRQFVSLSLNPPRDRETFAIPPMEPNWTAPTASAEFLVDADIVSLLYHMHDRGKDAITRLQYADGRVETILSVPRYDFNWQMTYNFARPTRVPKGTKAIFNAHYNNTVRRGYLNPNKWVYWGDQTWEEMMGNWFGLIVDRDVDPNKIMKPLGNSNIGGGGEG